jgi:ABC-type enterochelin transport system permease subunit
MKCKVGDVLFVLYYELYGSCVVYCVVCHNLREGCAFHMMYCALCVVLCVMLCIVLVMCDEISIKKSLKASQVFISLVLRKRGSLQTISLWN